MTALAAYRSILRATRVAFAGDHRVLNAARSQARSQFNSDRLMVPNSSEADARIAHANEVAVFLRQNVVQGEKKEGGEEQEYKIKIHAETERGDNETIKSAGKVDRGKTDLSGTGAKFRKCS